MTIDPPVTQLVSASVFTSDATATAALVGIYSQMMSSSGFISGNAGSIACLSGLSSDELINYDVDINQTQFYVNNLAPVNNNIYSNCWSEPYKYVYQVNAVLEGLKQSTGVSDPIKQQLSGEASFIRAICYFYLVNLFGDVPLILSTNYLANAKSARTSSVAVYKQIIADLKTAQAQLSSDFSFSNGERVRPNQWAATALLARGYLYTKDWAEAEAQATALIDNGSFSLASNLDSVFLANSSEAIWQLMPVYPGYNTNEGSNFILFSSPAYFSMSNTLLSSFEGNDQRRTHWVDSLVLGATTFYYPYKYKISSSSSVTEYSMVFRLAEQYLIRAEARAEQNDFPGAAQDINVIRSRAGLPNTIANDQPSLLAVIQHERQVELFTEGGHRWLDLKRTGAVDSTMILQAPLKGGTWQSSAQWYPIPSTEIQRDPALTQNAGY